MVSCLVSHVLLSAWSSWCLVFVSGELVCVISPGFGLGRDRTFAHWITHSVGIGKLC